MKLQLLLAQVTPWEETPAPPTPPRENKPLTLSDFQKGLHDYNTGNTDNGFRNGILIFLVLVALVVLILHFRQRHKTAGTPDHLGKLGRELARIVRFPFGSRMLLKWVARSTKTPFPSLLLSAGLFDKAVREWSAKPTFGAARNWGLQRLQRLRPVLFDN